jgi:hypothetical protein
MRYFVMFLLAASLTMFTLGCGGEEKKKTKTNGEKAPVTKTDETK